jgi:hypothetical protein
MDIALSKPTLDSDNALGITVSLGSESGTLGSRSQAGGSIQGILLDAALTTNERAELNLTARPQNFSWPNGSIARLRGPTSHESRKVDFDKPLPQLPRATQGESDNLRTEQGIQLGVALTTNERVELNLAARPQNSSWPNGSIARLQGPTSLESRKVEFRKPLPQPPRTTQGEIDNLRAEIEVTRRLMEKKELQLKMIRANVNSLSNRREILRSELDHQKDTTGSGKGFGTESTASGFVGHFPEVLKVSDPPIGRISASSDRGTTNTERGKLPVKKFTASKFSEALPEANSSNTRATDFESLAALADAGHLRSDAIDGAEESRTASSVSRTFDRAPDRGR